MTDTLSWQLLAYTVSAIPALVAFHVVQCRATAARGGSPQTRLAWLVISMNVLLFLGVVAIARLESRTFGDMVRMTVFFLAVFNGIAYSYFHFFNMSETARRIRMLIQIQQHGGQMERAMLVDTYRPSSMISSRLERLVQMRQIHRTADGRYRLVGRFLLSAAYAMEWLKRILCLRDGK